MRKGAQRVGIAGVGIMDFFFIYRTKIFCYFSHGYFCLSMPSALNYICLITDHNDARKGTETKLSG